MWVPLLTIVNSTQVQKTFLIHDDIGEKES